MKLLQRIVFRVLLLVFVMLALCGPRFAFADPLVWDLPGGIGTVGLPFQSTEIVMGYDLVLKQVIGGASLPVLSLAHNIADLHVGAVGAAPTQSANVQPYVALGHDVARDIPVLAQFKSLHLNGFGRWAPDHGPDLYDQLGAGVSVSYSFGQ